MPENNNSKMADFWQDAPLSRCLDRLAGMRLELEECSQAVQNRIAQERQGMSEVECVSYILSKRKKMKFIEGCRKKFDGATSAMKMDRNDPKTGLILSFWWCSEACYRAFNIETQKTNSRVADFLPDRSHYGQASGQ